MNIRNLIGGAALALVLSTGLAGCSLVDGAVNAVSNGTVAIDGLPTDWPADVPVVPGNVSGGVKTSDGWTALVKANSATGLADAQKLLKNYGFVEQSNVSSNGTGIVVMVNTHYTVTLTGKDDGVLYVIAPAR